MDDPLLRPQATVDFAAQARAKGDELVLVKASEAAIVDSKKLLSEIAAETDPNPLLSPGIL